MSETETKGFTNQAKWTALGSNDYFSNDNDLIGAYTSQDVVYTCAEMNATATSSYQYHLYEIVSDQNTAASKSKVRHKHKKKISGISKKAMRTRFAADDDIEIQEVLDHPFLRFLDSIPWKLLNLNVEIYGRAYIVPLDDVGDYPSTNEIPTSCKLLKSALVTPDRDAEGNVIGYTYANFVDGRKQDEIKLKAEEVLVFRQASVSDPYGGAMSWVRAALTKIGLASGFNDYLGWLVKNRARPDYIVSAGSENADKDEIKRIEHHVRSKISGDKNGDPLFTTENLKITPLNFPPTDMAPLALDERTTMAVCNAAGIPPALLAKDANYANMEASLTLWAKKTLLPRLCNHESVLNPYLDQLDLKNLFIEFDNPVPTDEKQTQEEEKINVTKAQSGYTAGVLTKNELRQLLGFPALDDGSGDELVVPASPVAPQAPAAEDDPEPTTEQTDAPEGEPSPAKGIDVVSLLAINKSVAGGDLDRATAINIVSSSFGIDQVEAKKLVGHVAVKAKPKPRTMPAVQLPPTNQKLVDALRKNFDVQREHYLGQLNGQKSADDISTKEAGDDGEDDLPDAFVPLDEWDDDLAHDVRPVIQLETKKAADGRQQALVRVGASPDAFSVVPQKINDAVDKATLRFCADTNATTSKNLNDALDALRQELKDGLFEGDSKREMTKRVQSVFVSADQDRAGLIAQTETNRAVHTGQQIVAKESGIVKGFKLFISDESCDLCQEYEGTEIGLDDKFNPDDDYADSPLPIHPGCRCTMMEVLDLGDDDDE